MKCTDNAQAIRSGEPLLLLDVICPHCEREHYASNVRLIQPLASIYTASSEQTLIALQPCIASLQESDSQASDAGDVHHTSQAGFAGLVQAGLSGPEIADQTSPTIPELELSYGSNLATSPSLSDFLSSTSSATSQNNVSMQTPGGKNTIPSSQTEAQTSSRLSRIFGKTTLSATEPNVRHAWSANARFILIWSKRSMTILDVQSRKINQQNLSGVRIAAMGTQLRAVVYADRGVRTNLSPIYAPLTADR
jgi:hypothetical protein